MKNLFTTLLLIICCLTQLNAQELEDRRSVKSGNWSDADTWERYTATGWVTPAAVQSQRNYTIAKNHTVTVNNATCNSLTVEEGAVLRSVDNAGSGTKYLRVGHANTGTVIIQNDGLIGSTESGIGGGLIIESSASAQGFKLTGNGICRIARLRIQPNTQSHPLVMEIDQDVTVTDAVGPFTAYINNSASRLNENYTITINANKTVKIANSGGTFHMGFTTPDYITSNPGGNYTYNINGTLDLSESSSTSHIIPLSNNSNSTVTVNVNGIIKTGTGLNFVNSAPSANNNGNVIFNVNNGGVIDATKATTLTTGENYFRLAGSGTVKRSVGNTDVAFPVGLQSASSANQVILNNSGTESNFSVNLQGTFDTEPLSTQVVNRQWNITPEEAGANANIKLQWKTNEQGTGFDALQSISLARLNGSVWNPSAVSTITGPDANGFYEAEVGGITSFGAFSLQNSSTLPLNFTSFKTTLSNTKFSPEVTLDWTTQNEVNTEKFIIERSLDGINFISVGSLLSKNISGVNNYSFIDRSPLPNTSYYRLKQVDKDGKFDFSDVRSINNSLGIQLSVYPNPVSDVINISHPVADYNSRINIYDLNSQLLISSKVEIGTSSTTIKVNGIASSLYFVSFEKQDYKSLLKFMKK